jgi:hypothetical protein
MSDRDRLAHDAQQEDDINRKHGEFILAAIDDAKERQGRGDDPLLEAINRAHQAKASEAEADQQ